MSVEMESQATGCRGSKVQNCRLANGMKGREERILRLGLVGWMVVQIIEMENGGNITCPRSLCS